MVTSADQLLLSREVSSISKVINALCMVPITKMSVSFCKEFVWREEERKVSDSHLFKMDC